KPFVAETLPALFYLICKQEPRPIEQANPALTTTVGKVLQRALAKDPNQRFASCGDFVGTLSIALGDCAGWARNPNAASLVERGMLQATADTGSKRGQDFAVAVSKAKEENPRPTLETASNTQTPVAPIRGG